jgi:hypothetical protein
MMFKFSLFPELKTAFKGWRFKDIIMIQGKLQDTLAKFQTMYITVKTERWHDHWARYIQCKGEYFDGGTIN